MTDRSDDDLIDLAELAGHLKVTRKTVNRMVASGRLPAPTRYGGLVRWRWGVIREWHVAMEMLERLQVGFSGTQQGFPGTSEPADEIPPSERKKRS